MTLSVQTARVSLPIAFAGAVFIEGCGAWFSTHRVGSLSLRLGAGLFFFAIFLPLSGLVFVAVQNVSVVGVNLTVGSLLGDRLPYQAIVALLDTVTSVYFAAFAMQFYRSVFAPADGADLHAAAKTLAGKVR